MRHQPFTLSGEQPARLEVRWDGSTARVYFDGVHQADLRGADAMKKGWSTTLEDGSLLEIRSITRVLLPELSVLRAGQHLPSSPSHPQKMLNTTSTTMMALGTFLLVAGAFQIWGKNWWSAAFGLFYLVGGFLIRRRFYVGIVVAMVPLVGSVAFLLLAAFTAGVTTRWLVDVLLTLLFVSFLVRSVFALRDTRQLEGLEPVA